MANTYTQLHIQLVFAVKYREALIQKEWKERLHQYITGILQQNEHKLLQINSMPDHIHIFIGMRPHQSISALMQNAKSESTKWINNQKLCASSFNWQEGYGAFSYGRSQIDQVCKYVLNQKQHHAVKSFKTEYIDLLTLFEISFNDKYLFEFYD